MLGYSLLCNSTFVVWCKNGFVLSFLYCMYNAETTVHVGSMTYYALIITSLLCGIFNSKHVFSVNNINVFYGNHINIYLSLLHYHTYLPFNTLSPFLHPAAFYCPCLWEKKATDLICWYFRRRKSYFQRLGSSRKQCSFHSSDIWVEKGTDWEHC